MKLFISYRSLDSAKVDTIVSRLRNMQPVQGLMTFEPWQDKYGIPAGKDWWIAICEAIETCDVFVFMVSQESIKNINCRAELNYAHNLNKPILPIVLADEHSYNSTTGKNEISFWDDIPNELQDARTQFLFYEGTAFVKDMIKAIDEFQKNPKRRLPANRPRDPRETANESNSSVILYDEACDYAWRMDFETAKKLFRNLINNHAEFADEATEWFVILTDYQLLVQLASKTSTHFKLKENWDLYTAKFPLPFLPSFDPEDIYQIIEHQQTASDKNTFKKHNIPEVLSIELPNYIDDLNQSSYNATLGLSLLDNLSNHVPIEDNIHELDFKTSVVPHDSDWNQQSDSRLLGQSSSSNFQNTTDIYNSQRVYELNAWRPLDWLQLLYWILVNPKQLVRHRESYGVNIEKYIGDRLVATAFSMPLLLWVISLALNPQLATTFSIRTNISLYGAILITVGLWIFSGILSWIKTNTKWDRIGFGIYVMFVILIIIVFVEAMIVSFVISINQEGATLFILAVILAYIAGIEILGIVAMDLTNDIILIVTFISAFPSAIIFIGYTGIGYGFWGFFIGPLLINTVIGAVSYIIRRSIQQEKPTIGNHFLTILLLITIAVSYTILIGNTIVLVFS